MAARRVVILAITGPTAVGKSAVALERARAVGGEIVSADSRQVYRGLDVGTAKPTAEERALVRHHFVDERDPGEGFTAGTFAREAEPRIDAILARGAEPVVVGGSLLYLDALVRGIADLPALPSDLRDALTDEAATTEGRAALFAELNAADPAAAATLDPSKSHRLVRLVGVLRTTGAPSALWASAPPPRFRYRIVVLERDRAELYARIDARVDQMLDAGLVDETQRLLDVGYAPDRGALNTIGYAEAAAHLRGEIDAGEMRRLIQRNTRRFAKRQLTWLRNRCADAEWLPAADAAARLA